MNVIFLDIDGVLNSSDSVLAKIGLVSMTNLQRSAHIKLIQRFADADADLPYGAKFALLTADPTCVGLLNRLLRETDAKIVLSSTHRSNFTSRPDGGMSFGSAEHLHYLDIFLTAMGVQVNDRLIGVTQQYSGGTRGDEVQKYIDDHFEIDEYIILDDSTDFNFNQPLIRCDPHNGFSRLEFMKASVALGVEQSMILTF